MKDPYRVLGVSPDASDDQIKNAYRELARKYHPDNYVNNPLGDLAQEKMKEINEAYDTIQRMRQSGQTGYGGQTGYSGQTGQGYYYQQSSSFADVRRLIHAGRVAQAEELLDGVPLNRRDGEWYFLKGSICYSRGWLEQALEHFNRACELSPQNPEYRAALNQLLWQRQNGYARGGGYQRMNGTHCDCCDLCAAFYCANCCCNCLGGGF